MDLARSPVGHPSEQLRRKQIEQDQLAQRLNNAIRSRLTREQLRIAQSSQRLVTPLHVIQREQQGLQTLTARSLRAMQNGFVQRRLNLERLSSSLAHLSPEGVLARGYSIVQLENGAVVQDAATLGTGDTIDIRFMHGRARATVASTSQD